MSTKPIAAKVLEYARAMRVARTLSAAQQPIPPNVTQILASGEALYNSCPPHVQRAIDDQLRAASLQIDNQLIAERYQSEERNRQADAAFREAMFERASHGLGGEAAVRAAAAGEKAIPINVRRTDKRGNTFTEATTRTPSNAERRRAQLVLAAEQHGLGELMAADVNGRRVAELREAERAVNPRADNKRVDILNALDAHDAVAYDAPEPDVADAPVESPRETITRSWDSLSDSASESSQDSN